MKNLFIICDKNKKSEIIRSKLLRKIKTTSLKKSQIIIVIGGDGFMLQTLKKMHNLKKNFYGINSGNYGFLMNKFYLKKINKNLLRANKISISPLEMTVLNKSGSVKRAIAITNERNNPKTT